MQAGDASFANESSAQVTFLGKPIVAGLVWEALPERTGSGAKREIRRLAALHGCDLSVVHAVTSISGQVGLIRSSVGGAKDNAYALVPCLAGKLRDNWTGVFQLNENTWAAAAVAEGGAIRLDIAGAYESVMVAWRKEIAEYNAFGNTYASLYIDPAVPQDETAGFISSPMGLDTIFSGPQEATFSKANRLAEVGRRLPGLPAGALGGKVVLLVGIVAAMATLVGYKLYSDHAAAERERLAAEQREKEKAAAAHPSSTPMMMAPRVDEPKPWESEPGAVAFLTACGNLMDQMPLSIGKGWVIDHQECDLQVGTVAAIYHRQGNATVGDFREDVLKAFNVLPDVKQGADEGGFQLPLPTLPNGAEPLLSRTVAEPLFYSHFQRVGQKLNGEPAQVAPQTEDEAKKFKPRSWTGWTFEINGTRLSTYPTVDPETHKPVDAQLLSGLTLPGLRITHLHAERLNSSPFVVYNVKGTFYAN